MQIWVDADACPAAIKEILFRAATRTKVMLTLIANQQIHIPNAQNINMIRVSSGFDVADNEIVKKMQAGDLVITNDIPLAAEVIEKGGSALSPRGEVFTKDNIGARLNIRDFMETMRASGVKTGGPAPQSLNDRKTFADQLDKFLAKMLSKQDQS